MIDHLRTQLQKPLPGKVAQYRMAHQIRRGSVEAPADAKQAAVLALFFPKNEAWHLAFIERKRGNANDRHAGQISFPGGQYEQQDRNLQMTALRETEEEIAVPRGDIQVLGTLSELYIPVSNFAVHPFVGYIDHYPAFKAELSEVHAILEVPFQFFQDETNLQLKDISISERITLREVPYFDLDGRVLWGATAMMMGELLAVLE